MDVPDASPDPERAAIASDRLRRVMVIIETMPPRRKEVFLLHRLENATYREISQRLGISPKTVEKLSVVRTFGATRGVDQRSVGLV